MEEQTAWVNQQGAQNWAKEGKAQNDQESKTGLGDEMETLFLER